MPLVIEQLNLSSYDLVISNSHAVAKGVLIGPGLCVPLRISWLFDETENHVGYHIENLRG